jgi:hypothetical protein
MNVHRIVVAASLSLVACSGSHSSAHEVTQPEDLAGGWRICDAPTEQGKSPTEYNHLPLGGVHFDIAAEGDTLTAISSERDGGSSDRITGTIDMSTRVWTAHVDSLGGTSTFTFSADGTQLTGMFVGDAPAPVELVK